MYFQILGPASRKFHSPSWSGYVCCYNNPYLYLILSIVFDIWLSYYLIPINTSLLDSIHQIYVNNSFPIIYLLGTASNIKANSNVGHPLKRLLSERIINTCKTRFYNCYCSYVLPHYSPMVPTTLVMKFSYP